MRNPKTEVAVVKCGDYVQNDVDRAVEEAVNLLGGIRRFVKKGDKVLLKINLLIGKAPEYAVTTHPTVVRAIIRLIKKAGGLPAVGDSPSAGSLQGFGKSLEIAGIKKVCDELNVPTIELDRPIQKRVDGRITKSFMVSSRLDEFDVIINMPKLKTHTLTLFTGAVKNLFGCISGRKKGIYHVFAQDAERFSELLLDLNQIIKPQLNIMDGIIGMDGNGPAAGDPKKMGLIIAGNSALAVDTVAIEIIGMRKEVPLLRLAQSRKLEEADLKKIKILGKRLEEVRINDFRRPGAQVISIIPKWARRLFRYSILQKPFVNERLCIGCGSCVRICPKKAITLINKKPRYDYGKCIRCYCCQEVCPEKAIFLKDTLGSRILGISGK